MTARRTFLLTVVFTLVALLAIGCGRSIFDDTGGSGGSGGSAFTTGTGGTGTTGGVTSSTGSNGGAGTTGGVTSSTGSGEGGSLPDGGPVDGGSPIVSIQITPASVTLALGGTQTFTAIATLADMTTVNVTQTAIWASSAAAVASVSNAAGSQGVATAVGAGTATISATSDGVVGSATVTISAAPLVSIALTPADASLPKGSNLQLTATGTYADNTTADVTQLCSYTTDDGSIASVSNAPGSVGKASALAVGKTGVHATLQGITGSTTLTVSTATLSSITLSPASPTLAGGATQQMTATGHFSDNTTVDLTASAAWTTASSAVAIVGNQGLVTAVGQGTTTVTATFNGVSGSTTITVSAPVLVSITVAPIAPTLQVGGNQPFNATGIYSNNTQKNLTQQAQWASSDAAVGGFQNGGPQKSFFSALGVGTTTVSATYQGITGSTPVTVKSATLVSITVTPAIDSVVVGTTVQYTAAAIYSDNTSAVITGQCTWTSSSPSVAGITTGGGMMGPPGGPGMGGSATALAAGTTTISCTYSGITGSATLTVTAATITTIEVTPFNPTIGLNATKKFTATAIFSDNTTQNVTNQATWISSNSAVAQVTTAGMNKGLATALSTGSTTISATYQGITGSTTLTVTSATLVTIQVTPFSPTLPIGFDTGFVATGIYSDNSTQDLTALVTWLSSAPAVAAVSAAPPNKGRVQPLSAGTASITASYQGITGTDTVTVTSATLSSITVSPANATVGVGVNQAFLATGTFSNNTTLDVTTYVTWLSSAPATGDVSNAAGSQGVATGLSASPSPVTITAIRGMVSGTAQLTVQ